MQQEALTFLDSKRTGVISVEMLDGSPHAATIHFAYQKDPLAFVFLTSRSSRKIESLLGGSFARASLVIGTEESEMKTMQLDGMAALLESDDLQDAYFDKFPEKKEKYGGPDDIFFMFKPTWWRFTDYKAPGGKSILTSE